MKSQHNKNHNFVTDPRLTFIFHERAIAFVLPRLLLGDARVGEDLERLEARVVAGHATCALDRQVTERRDDALALGLVRLTQHQ